MAAFYDRAYGRAYSHEFSTANYGYGPVDDAVAREAPSEPHQIQLYAEAVKALRAVAPALAPQTLLEICCGRGGGLAHVRRALAPPATIGLERSLPAVRYARARDPAATFVQGDGARLPFKSASIDVAFNIEAMSFFPRPAFIAEVSRVLAPGGHFVTAESFPQTPESVRREFGDLADGHGLELASFRDITGNVHESCIADEGRRRRLVANTPFYYRPFAREFACLPGSPRFQQFAERSRCYFIAVMTRLGTAAP